MKMLQIVSFLTVVTQEYIFLVPYFWHRAYLLYCCPNNCDHYACSV